MSCWPLQTVDSIDSWCIRIADVARACDLADLALRCTVALATLLPDQQAEMVWNTPAGPQLLAGDAPALTLPNPDQLGVLAGGLSVVDQSAALFYQPLCGAGALWGWLTVQPLPLYEGQQQALKMLAAVAAPTLALLVGQTMHRDQDRRRAVIDAVHRLRGLLALDRVLAELQRIVLQHIAAPTFFVVLRDTPGDWLEIVSFAEEGRQRPVRQFWRQEAGLTGEVLRTRQLIRTDDYVSECQQRGVVGVSLDGVEKVCAWMGAPLLAHDQPVGVVCVFHSTPEPRYSALDAALLALIADEAAGAIQNARLYARVERQAHELAALNRIGRTITSTLDPEQVPQLIMQQVHELLEVEEGSLLLLDPQSGDLVFSYASGPTGSRLIGRRLPPRTGIAGFVASSGRSEIVNDIRSDGRFYTGTDKDTGFVTRSLLAVPLRDITGVQGVIEVLNKRDNAPFTADDRQLLEAVADQAVIALENARRFAQVDQALARRALELDRTNNQLREILQLGNTLRVERRFDELLRQIVQAVSQSTGFRTAEIALVQRARTAEPYLQRMVMAGPVEAEMRRLGTVRAPLDRLEALLRPEFQRGPATYLVDHRYDDFVQLWGGIANLYIPDLVPAPHGGWHPLDALFSVMRNAQGEVIGLLCVNEPESGLLPSPEQVQILEIFANQAALAIENARLYNEQQHHLLRMMALNGLGIATLNATLQSVEQIVALTTSGMAEMTGAAAAAALLRSADALDLIDASLAAPLQPVDVTLPDPVATDPPLLDRLARNAMASGRMVVEAAAADAVTWLAIPLRAARQIVGAICLGYYDGVPPPADLETLTLFATQAAVAVESIRLFNAVRQGRDQLESIMASTREGMLLVDEQQSIVVANRAFHELASIADTSEAAGAALVDPAARPRLDALLARWQAVADYPAEELQQLHSGLAAVAQGVAPLARGELNRRSGGVQVLEWTVLQVAGQPPTTPAAARATGLPLLVIVRDITAAKEAERLRQDLTNMIVHDLRSPLASIMASMDMLSRGVAGTITAGQQNVLNIAHNSARYLLDMVGMLLDISRLESGQMPLERVPTAVDTLVAQAVEHISLVAHDRQVMIEVTPPEASLAVNADRDLIVRVLQNLLDNAIKYSGDRRRVVVQALPRDGVVAFVVRDFGPGIAARDQEKIFRRFSQVGHQRRNGSGLGLTFCKLVVEAHGGQIWVESTLGAGSTFTFTLPFG